jgi:hypothetical protein
MPHPQPKKFVNNFAFIDSQNLNLGIKSQGWSLDFVKFRKFLDKFRVVKAFVFIGYVEENNWLYKHLTSCGYEKA